ncbi:MAG: GNAT family N-acetyltransferase [Flavobacteriales bacterium]|nr:GNAT family N-acetyltransferase [Flavobacteriales bacterium]MBP9078669.1 GNAT family N-acetyltransferase [Flavobacteriales bacterium]
MLRTDFKRIPRLSTARMELRALRDSDAADVFRLRASPAVMRHIPKPIGTRQEEGLQLVREFHHAAAGGNAIMWAITVKGSDVLLGYIGFWRILKEHHRAEIGYALHPDLWGQGLMSEAVAAVVDHGFRKIGLHSVEAAVTPDNAASIHVLEHNGFVLEGHLRENILVNGIFRDTLVFTRHATARASHPATQSP